MKFNKIISALVLTAALFCASAVQAGGPLKFGIKAGMTVNEMKFNEKIFNSENRCGYTAGVMTKFTAPIIGLGFDASVMFTHRSMHVMGYEFEDEQGQEFTIAGRHLANDYIEIPINLRWDINIPGAGAIVTPFLTTGPDLSFLVSKKNIDNAWNNKTFDFAWNFGFGLVFVDKVQLHASYGLGLNNAASSEASLYGKLGDGKNRFWTVTAAYIF